MIYTVLAKDSKRIMKVLVLLAPLFDASGENLKPREFWQAGTYFTHPARVKAVLLNLAPARQVDQVALGREAMDHLEARKGLVTDWGGGSKRGSG